MDQQRRGASERRRPARRAVGDPAGPVVPARRREPADPGPCHVTPAAGRKTSPAGSNGRRPTSRSAGSTSKGRRRSSGRARERSWPGTPASWPSPASPFRTNGQPAQRGSNGRSPETAELHRRTDRQATGAAQPARLTGVQRRRVRAPRLRRHDRPPPHDRRSPGLSCRRFAIPARCADRQSARPAGVQRLLDLQMVRPADAQRHAAAARRRSRPTTSGSTSKWPTACRGTSSCARSSRPPARASRTAPRTSTR